MEQKITIEMICFLLILLFVYVAVSKLWEHNTFKIQIGNAPYINVVAGIIIWLVPTVELPIVIILTATSMRFYGLLSAVLLLITFTGYIADMFLSGRLLPCSYGQVISGKAGKGTWCLTFSL